MPAIAFDTLHYVKRLQKAGVSAQQAEAQADVLSEVMSLNLDKLATKEDIKNMATKDDIAGVKESIAGLAGQMKIIVWVMGVMAAGMFGMLWTMFSIIERLH